MTEQEQADVETLVSIAVRGLLSIEDVTKIYHDVCITHAEQRVIAAAKAWGRRESGCLPALRAALAELEREEAGE